VINDEDIVAAAVRVDKALTRKFEQEIMKINREKQIPPAPEQRALQMNSITKLEALVPVRVATSKVLEGNWTGPALDEARVVGSLFGGAHYILQLGYNQVVGQAASFRLVFVAHMPVEKGTVLTDPVVIDEARRTAEAFMHMLNMRRVAGANATQTRQNAAGATLVSSFQGSGSAIPGKPLTGKRADVLIIDEVSDLKKPVV